MKPRRRKINVNNTQNVISFCTGYGGIELGLKLAGCDIRTVCYVEIEAFAIANLVAKIEESKMDAAPIWTDIKTFPAKYFSGKIHGIIGGYPCQPFSVAGKRKGAEDPRHLWPSIKTAVKEIKPRWAFFENVRGHVNLGLREVKRDLESLGYSVEGGIFSAEEVGAPHRRERIFILGNAKHDGLHGSEKPGSTAEAIRDNPERQKATSESTGTGDTGELADPQGGKSRQQETRNRGKGFERGSEAMADSGKQGLQRAGCAQPFRGSKPSAFPKNRSKNSWPAGPGEPQYDWEEPRTIKSGMGCSVDGFNARVDQLRLLGNGVVPHTAAKAWINLNKK